MYASTVGSTSCMQCGAGTYSYAQFNAVYTANTNQIWNVPSAQGGATAYDFIYFYSFLTVATNTEVTISINYAGASSISAHFFRMRIRTSLGPLTHNSVLHFQTTTP